MLYAGVDLPIEDSSLTVDFREYLKQKSREEDNWLSRYLQTFQVIHGDGPLGYLLSSLNRNYDGDTSRIEELIRDGELHEAAIDRAYDDGAISAPGRVASFRTCSK